MAPHSQLSTTRLGALASAFRRWRKFALPRQISVRQPTPLQLAEFFREVSRGGPTAAAALWQSLRWFEEKMGLRLGLQHFLVKPYQFLPANHSSVQAPELQPWEFVNMVLWARNQKGTNLVVVAFLIQAAVSCIRFEHVQRSTLTAHHEGWAEFWCKQGKKRIRGSRPGYAWCTTDVLFQGWSLLKIIREFLSHEALPDVPFLWPALMLQAEDCFDVTEATPFMVDKPMSRSRLLELLRGCLMQIGVPPAEATSSTYNRLRRFLPTLANVHGLEGADLQAVGSWVEVPSGGGPCPRVKSRACWLMGRHYGGNQCQQSAIVKQALLARFWAVFRKKMGELALTEAQLLTPNSWTWEEFTATSTAMGALEFAPVSPPQPVPPEVVIDADSTLDPALHPALGAAEDPGPVDLGEIRDSDSEELEDLPPLDNVVDGMEWFKQGSKTHITRAKDDTHRPVPWCRDSAFLQDARVCGVGFGTCTRAHFCQRCLARLPRGAYTAIADICGWLH
eukprot:s412_g10.t1